MVALLDRVKASCTSFFSSSFVCFGTDALLFFNLLRGSMSNVSLMVVLLLLPEIEDFLRYFGDNEFFRGFSFNDLIVVLAVKRKDNVEYI